MVPVASGDHMAQTVKFQEILRILGEPGVLQARQRLALRVRSARRR